MSSAQINNTIDIRVVIDADATSGFSVTCPRALTVVDVVAVATATSVGGTAAVSSAGGAISDAFALATADAVSRAATIDPANATVAAGATLTVTTNGAADRGEVTIICHAPGQTLDAP